MKQKQIRSFILCLVAIGIMLSPLQVLATHSYTIKNETSKDHKILFNRKAKAGLFRKLLGFDMTPTASETIRANTSMQFSGDSSIENCDGSGSFEIENNAVYIIKEAIDATGGPTTTLIKES